MDSTGKFIETSILSSDDNMDMFVEALVTVQEPTTIF
jgi:hypothetical protein